MSPRPFQSRVTAVSGAPKTDRGRRHEGVGGESGFVLIVAMAVLLVALALSAAAVEQAVQVSSKANRDPRVKAALQAADAGVQAAIFRLNSLAQYLSNPATLTPCVEATVDGSQKLTGLVLEAALSTGPSWCPVSPAQAIGNGESFSYQMSPILQVAVGANPPDPDGLSYTLDRRIVGTGIVTGPGGAQVMRRVVQTVSAAYLPRLFYDYALIGQRFVKVSGGAQAGSATSPANIRSNKDVIVSLSSGGVQCGNLTYGPPGSGGTFSGTATGCPVGQTVSAAPSTLQLPTIGPPPTNNNAALASACLLLPSCTFIGGNLALAGSPAINLVVPAGNYELCSVSVSGASTLTMGGTAATPVNMYIDPPSSTCTPQSTGAFYIAGSSTLAATTPGISPGAFQLLVAGLSASPGAASTEVNLAGSSTLLTPITIVAPYSNVNIAGGSNLTGAALGDSVTVQGNAVFTPFPHVSLPTSSGSPLYRKGAYNECATSPPSAGSPPDQGC